MTIPDVLFYVEQFIVSQNVWKRTWWTNSDDERYKNLEPIPVNITKASVAIDKARKSFPNGLYRIARA